MPKDRIIIIWVAGAAGIILLYAAYKGKSPTSILTSYTTGGKPTALGVTDTADPSNQNTVPITNIPDTPTTVVPQFDSTMSVYDQNGNTVADVPYAYRNSPATFVPSQTNV